MGMFWYSTKARNGHLMLLLSERLVSVCLPVIVKKMEDNGCVFVQMTYASILRKVCVCLSVCLSFFLSVCLSVCPSTCLLHGLDIKRCYSK